MRPVQTNLARKNSNQDTHASKEKCQKKKTKELMNVLNVRTMCNKIQEIPASQDPFCKKNYNLI